MACSRRAATDSAKARSGGRSRSSGADRAVLLDGIIIVKPSPSAPLPVRPAATVLVLRDSPHGPEVFMVRRHVGTAFMGGAQVFPGGRVEHSDEEGDET